MAYETDAWEYIEARYFGVKRVKPPRLIVIHTPEWKESSEGAEAVAKYFASMPDGRVASAHICVDNTSVIQCVRDSFVAYAAPGANNDGLQLELTGFAGQTPAQWRDPFSVAALALAADAAAQWCLKYDIGPIKLSDQQLQAGNRGIVGHDQVSAVYKKSTHTDPGPNFPWSRFMSYLDGAILDRTP